MIPVPAPALPWYPNCELTSTIAGSTFAAIAAGLEGPPFAVLVELPPLPAPPKKPGKGLAPPLPVEGAPLPAAGRAAACG